jgi:toxin ParE1/3/4
LIAPIAAVAPAARRDLDQYTLRLHEEAGPETARKFAAAAIGTFAKTGEAPGLGGMVSATGIGLTGLRKWRVAGFPGYLFFYRPVPAEIEVVRVLHASQDWWSLFDPA